MTRITIVAVGLRGDVQPLIALGRGLKNAGYKVRVASQPDFGGLVKASGLEHYALSGEARRFFAGPAGLALRSRLGDAAQFTRFWRAYVAPMVLNHLSELPGAAAGADAVICPPWFQASPTLAEARGVPCLVACVMPVPAIPTAEFPYPFQDSVWGQTDEAANRTSWEEGEWFAGVAFPELGRWRVSLNLPAVSWDGYLACIRSTPHLFGYSRHVLPKPRDWGAAHHVTGYWFPDDDMSYTPPEELRRFLDAGPPPLVLGFSSQASRRNAELSTLFAEALGRTGRRGILLTGWGGLKAVSSSNVFTAGAVPYEWLLPRAAAMVHHGGAGTVGECLRRGVPSVAIPLGYDGHFWGRRVAALGAGLAPLSENNLDLTVAAEVITRLCEDRSVRERSRRLSHLIRDEDGVRNAVRHVESHLGAATN